MSNLSGKKMTISGKPIEWAKYLSDGEFDCSRCLWNEDSDRGTCDECCDYGTSFVPKDEE